VEKEIEGEKAERKDDWEMGVSKVK